MNEDFKQTDIGLIPEDWELKELSQASEIIMGQSPPSSTYNSEGFGLPFYQGKTDFGNVYPTPRIWCTSPSKISKKDDILISVRAPVGPTNLSFEKSGIGRGLSAIRATENHFLYLYYYLKKIEKEIEKLGTGSTFKAINKSQLYNINIPLPPLPEQKKIAHVLSKIQQAIETQEQIIKTTQELKKALMHKLFTEGLNDEPQKQTEIGLIPESWEVVPLKEAVSYIDYGLSEAIPKNQDFEGVKNVSTADITREGKLLYHKVRRVQTTNRIIERLKLKDGDVLFNWRNSSELIGKTTIYIEQPETHIFASFILRIRCDEIKYHNYFLTYLMNHYREQGVFFQLSRRAVNQANYNRNEIYVLKIPKPTYNEQVKIANAFRKIDDKIELLTEQLNTKKQLFNNTLNQLMTGQIRVKDIEFKLVT